MQRSLLSVPKATVAIVVLLLASSFLGGSRIHPEETGAESGAPFGLETRATIRRSAEGTVVLADDVPRQANPSGDQELTIAGPVLGFDSLDPALARDLETTSIVRQLFRGLTRLDAAMEPVPELANRIDINAEGTEYRFQLRENATFQDGRPITAADVAFSFNRALNPETAGGDLLLLGGPTFLSDIAGFDQVMRGEADELAGVTVEDERTVTIRLSSPRATFLMKLASVPASIVDKEDVAEGEGWWTSPNGSGPFAVDAYDADQRLTLRRADEYFAGPAPLEQITILLGPGASQSFNLYQAGDIDVGSVGVGGVDRVLAPESGLANELTITPLFAVSYIAFRSDIAPLDDPNIRRAIQLGFPRERIAEVSYRGHVRPAEGMIPDGMLGQSWPVRYPDYDVEAARDAIAASTYGSAENVPPIEIYVSGYEGAEALRDSLAESLGLQIEVINVEWSEFVAGLARRSYPAYELYWGADYPDPEGFLWMLFGSGRPDNYIGYSNDTFDQLLADAAAEDRPEKRAELIAEANQLLIDDGVVIPLTLDVAYTLQKPYVKGLEMTPLGILRFDSIWLER